MGPTFGTADLPFHFFDGGRLIRLSASELHTTVFPIIAQMRRLETFVARLYSVATVTLNLEPTGHGCLSTGTDEYLAGWAGQYGALLSCIIQAGCRSLTDINGAHLTETCPLDEQGWSERYLSRAVQCLFLPRTL
jgi:hypothetical protein